MLILRSLLVIIFVSMGMSSFAQNFEKTINAQIKDVTDQAPKPNKNGDDGEINGTKN